MSRKLRAAVLVLLATLVTITLVVPSSLAYLIDTTSVARNTFVMAPALNEVQVPITVMKTIKSLCDGTISPEGFTFVLTDSRTGETQTAVSDAEGKATFLLSYSGLDEGEYNFTLHEQNDWLIGVTYDDTVYNIQVRIVMDELPWAEIAVDGMVVDVCEVSFENIYEEEFPDIPDTGDHAQPVLWLAMLLFSGYFLIVRPVQERKKRA